MDIFLIFIWLSVGYLIGKADKNGADRRREWPY